MENYQSRKYEILTEKFANIGQRIVSHQSGYLGLDANPGEGRVNRVGQPEQYPQSYVGNAAEAIAYVQWVAENYPDDFARWASTSDILQKADSGAAVRKATVNRSGQTSGPVSYPVNAIGSTPGSGKTVLTSELKKLTDSAEELFQQHRMAEGHLKARIFHVSKL